MISPCRSARPTFLPRTRSRSPVVACIPQSVTQGVHDQFPHPGGIQRYNRFVDTHCDTESGDTVAILNDGVHPQVALPRPASNIPLTRQHGSVFLVRPIGPTVQASPTRTKLPSGARLRAPTSVTSSPPPSPPS